MNALAGPRAEIAFCVALSCAALLAWTSAGNDGSAAARLRCLTGASTPEGGWRGWSRRRHLVGRARMRHGRLWNGLAQQAHRSQDFSGNVGRAYIGRGVRPGHVWWCLPVGGLLTGWSGSPVPAVLTALALPVGHRWAKSREERAAADHREGEVIDLCAVAAGEVRAGRLPHEALLATRAIRLGPEGSRILAAARFGGDVPAALLAAADVPGAQGLRGVAACWSVSADGGTGLADGLDKVAEALRAERAQRADVRTELAGPRSTATVLALLPVFGLLLGTAMGAHPVGVLLHTPVGLGCLVVGVLLEGAGVAWVRWLVRRAEAGS